MGESVAVALPKALLAAAWLVRPACEVGTRSCGDGLLKAWQDSKRRSSVLCLLWQCD